MTYQEAHEIFQLPFMELLYKAHTIHLSVYKAYKDLPHFITTKLASIDTQRMEQDMNRAIEYGKKYNLYYIINQNYQNYQNHFKFGLDYRIFSKSAKVIEIKHNNYVNIKLEVL